MAKILVVEDDKKLAEAICDCLNIEKHTVEAVHHGGEAADLLGLSEFDLVVLDILLPGKSGIEICKELRHSQKNTAVLMLTGKDTVGEKEEGFDAGADDYLTKPFHVRELLARVKALLRRAARPITQAELSAGNIRLNVATHKVTRDGELIHLAPKEFSLLEFLIKNKGTIFSPEAILDRVWQSDNETSTEMIRSYIKRLRQKIDVPGQPSIIRTVHRLGYGVEEPQ